MLTYTEAKEIIVGLAGSFGTETIDFEKALGRTLAEPVFADQDYPPFNRATMDGYAMTLADIEDGIREFIIVETIFAGQTSQAVLTTGQCYKIMTGAAVPASANTIIQREVVTEHETTIKIQTDLYKAYQNISKQGEDVKEGESIIKSSMICSPATISVLAALGKTSVKVEKLPRVALFTTGDEIVQPGNPVSRGQIRNSNQYLLKALLAKWGIEPFLCEHVRDNKTDLYQMLAKGITGDIVLISGGVSAGDADYVPEILASLGVVKLFHKLAIKPGKPAWCGHLPGGAMVFALPGNPFSSLVTFTLLVETYLSQCFGLGDPESLTLPLNGERSKKTNVDEFFPVSIKGMPLAAVPISFNGSGDILAALTADGIAQHPAAINTLSSQNNVLIRKFRT